MKIINGILIIKKYKRQNKVDKDENLMYIYNKK